MHQGQIHGPSGVPFNDGVNRQDHANGTNPPLQATPPQLPVQPTPAAGGQLAVAEPKQDTKAADVSTDKKSKKDREKDNKLVYSDNEVSPEEKMAKLPRYAFDPKEREEKVLGAPDAAVTGVVSGPEDPVREGNRGPGRDN